MPTIDQSWAAIDAEITRLQAEGLTGQELDELLDDVRAYDTQVRQEFDSLSWPDQIALLNRNAARLFKIHNLVRLRLGAVDGDVAAFVDAVEADISSLFDTFLSAGGSNTYYYVDHASMQADIGNRANGNIGIVLADETKGGTLSYYSVSAGAWVYSSQTPIPSDFSGLTESTAPPNSSLIIVREGGVTKFSTVSNLIASALGGGSKLAVLDENEEITGTWNFATLPTFGGISLDEHIDDHIANDLFSAGANIALTYDDVLNSYTIGVTGLLSADIGDFTEAVQDAVGASATAGPGITVAYDDPAGTNTISHAETSSVADLASSLNLVDGLTFDTFGHVTGYTTRALAKSDIGLGSVENTALSTWTGSANIAVVGTISSGTWQGAAIANDYIAGIDQDLLTTSNVTHASVTATSRVRFSDLGSGFIDFEAATDSIGVKRTSGSSVMSISTTTSDVAFFGGINVSGAAAFSSSVQAGSLTLTTDLAVTHGGTGASTASGARSNLGVAIGSDVQAWDADLDALAADPLTATTAASTYQPLDAGLTSISGLATAADRMIYTTASDTYAVATLTSFARTILDDADATTVRATIGVDAAGTDNSTDVTIAAGLDYISIAGQELTLGQIDLATDVTGVLPIANGGTGASTAAGARTALNVDVAGTDNSTDVTLSGAYDYLTIAGQVITLNQVDLATDVSGALPFANAAFADQDLLTTSNVTFANGSFTGTLGVTGAATFSSTVTQTNPTVNNYYANFYTANGTGGIRFYDENNAGSIYGLNSAGTARFVLNANGVSYFTGGNVIVGGSSDSGETLQVDGILGVTGAATFTSTISAATGSTVGTLTLADGSITDSGGAISFGDENLTTTGTLASGNATVTGNLKLAGTGSGSGSDGSLYLSSTNGMVVYIGGTAGGSSNDWLLYNSSTSNVLANPTGTQDLVAYGDVTLSAGTLDVSGNVYAKSSTVSTSWVFDGSTDGGIAVGSGYQDGRLYAEGSQSASVILHDSGAPSNQRAIGFQINGSAGKIYGFNDSGTLRHAFMDFDMVTGAVEIASGDLTLSAGDLEVTTGLGRFGGSTDPASMTTGIILYNGTAPSAGAANAIALYSKDLTAGNTMMGIYGEGTMLQAGTPAAANGSIPLEINGTTVYVPYSTTAPS